MEIKLENIGITNEGFDTEAWVNINITLDGDKECNVHIRDLYFAVKPFYDLYLSNKESI